MSNSPFKADAIINNHQKRSVGQKVQQRINALKVGQKMQDLPEDLWHESFLYYVKEDPDRKGGPNLRIIRLDPDKPSLTITGYIFNKFVHPFEDRYITVREAARLQGFPDDVTFSGTITSTQLQVGNAVPIPLAKAVFQKVVTHSQATGYSHNPLHAISLFSGAGGMDIGAAQTGDVTTQLAIDNDENACKTLRNYFGNHICVLNQDIMQIANPLDIWFQQSGSDATPDIVYGGPPCQSFSQAGKQRAFNDDRGLLIMEFLRFVRVLNPAYFVMENVANLKGIQNGKLYYHIIEEMKKLKYHVNVAKLLAADFGTPQLRYRLFFIGSRLELGKVDMPQPTHARQPTLFLDKPYMTVREAFTGLPKL